MLRSRVLRGVYVIVTDIGRGLLLAPASTRVNTEIIRRRFSLLTDHSADYNPLYR